MKIETLSVKELQELKVVVEKELEKRKKEEYKVAPNRKVDYKAFYNHVMNLGNSGRYLGLSEDLVKIKYRCSNVVKLTDKEKYPCPECGRLSLYDKHVHIPILERDVYSIVCGACGFGVEAMSASNGEEAWESFKGWLVECGYLKESEVC